MQKNVGSTDKVIRMVLAAGLFSLFFILEGDLKYLSLVGFVPLLTGMVSFCPLYKIVGVCTK